MPKVRMAPVEPGQDVDGIERGQSAGLWRSRPRRRPRTRTDAEGGPGIHASPKETENTLYRGLAFFLGIGSSS